MSDHRFAVVEFYIESKVNKVPIFWVTADNKCYWPDGLDASKLIKKSVPPNKLTWKQHPIRLIRLCGKLKLTL